MTFIRSTNDESFLNRNFVLGALRLYSLVGEKLVSSPSAALLKKESSRAAASSLLEWSAKVQHASERHQVTPSDHSTPAAEDEGAQISEGSTNRRRAGSNSRLVFPDKQRRIGKPQKQVTRKRKTSIKNQRSNKKQFPADLNPNSFVGRRIAKEFDEGLFLGEIVSFRKHKTTTYWQVEYDDGDAEEFEYEEVLLHTKRYESSRSDTTVSEANCISDGEKSDAGTLHNPSMNVADESEGEPDEKQPEGSQLHAHTALNHLQQAVGEPTAVSENDEVDETIPSSDERGTFEV